MTRTLATLAALSLLASAPPALATPAPPRPQADPAAATPQDDPFPIFALAPCGFAAGYLLGGRPDRALLVPAGVYLATGAGGVIGLVTAWEKASIKRPVASVMGLLTGPVGGMAIGFGLTGGLALIDQATLAPPAGPWLAPLVSVGTIGAIVGAGVIQDRLQPDQVLTSP